MKITKVLSVERLKFNINIGFDTFFDETKVTDEDVNNAINHLMGVTIYKIVAIEDETEYPYSTTFLSSDFIHWVKHNNKSLDVVKLEEVDWNAVVASYIAHYSIQHTHPKHAKDVEEWRSNGLKKEWLNVLIDILPEHEFNSLK